MNSLRFKLTLAFSVIGLVGMLTAVAFFYYASTRGIYEGMEKRAEILSDEITYSLEILSEQQDAKDELFSIQRLVEKSSTLEGVTEIIVVDTKKTILAHSNKQQVGQLLNSDLIEDILHNGNTASQTIGQRIIFVRPLHGQAYTDEFHNVIGVLWIGMDVSDSVIQQQKAFEFVAIGVIVILLLFFSTQIITVNRIVVQRLQGVQTGIAKHMKSGESTAILISQSFGSEDEINELAQAYNYLITSWRDAIRKLQNERDFGLKIMDSMGEGLTITNHQGLFEYVNPAYAGLVGLTPREIEGRSPKEFSHPQEIVKQIKEGEIRKQGISSLYETILLTKDGAEVPVLISAVPRIVNGENIGSIAVVTNISDRAHIEEMSASLQRKLIFEELTAHLAATFMILPASEMDKAIQETLRQLGELFQVDRTYIFEFTADQAFMNNTHEWCAENISPQIENLQNLPTEILPWWVNLLKKGETINVPRVSEMPPEASTEKEILADQSIQSVLVTPISSENGLFGFLGLDSVVRERRWTNDEIQFLQVLMGIVMNTITRQRAEENLTRSESRNRAFLNAVPDLIFRISEDGTFLDFQSGAGNRLLAPPEAIIGQKVETILPGDISKATMAAIKTALETKKPQQFEYIIQNETGPLTYDARVVSSAAREVIVVAHDITERVRLEEMKTDFINRASHELRTPLTTAILMAELLEDDGMTEDKQEFLTVLKEELNRQRMLLNDLLIAGRIENKRFEVHLAPADIAPLIEEAVSSVKPQADAREITIQLEISEMPSKAYTDRQSLIQILLNLLSNAIKYSNPQTNIEVSACQREKFIEIAVRDHGMGIPAQDLPHIATRFYRAKNATQMEIQGSGIGLYIVKEILQSLGGEMKIESVESEGTTVSIFLPLIPDDDHDALA
jgi:PAS domain S-box-containing protein